MFSANDACDHPQCNLECPYGFEIGENDCPLCNCLDPCEVKQPVRRWHLLANFIFICIYQFINICVIIANCMRVV